MPELARWRWWAWLLVSAGVIVLDQLTKWAVQQTLVFGQSVPVLPFFNFVLVYNPGAAFSFLSTAPGWQRDVFVVVGLGATVWLRKWAPFAIW